jgi:hypothetical protein
VRLKLVNGQETLQAGVEVAEVGIVLQSYYSLRELSLKVMLLQLLLSILYALCYTQALVFVLIQEQLLSSQVLKGRTGG